MFTLRKGMHCFTDVNVIDQPGAGGAYHQYRVVPHKTTTEDEALSIFADIHFQEGPINEAEVNGVFMEDLLRICEHRLECFQAGKFACRENALALTKIQEALHWLDHRTKDRQQRGVEGFSQK